MNPFEDIYALHGWPGLVVAMGLLVLSAVFCAPVFGGAWLVLTQRF